jgi:arabinofuranan 3-O-arabinosyltransferase
LLGLLVVLSVVVFANHWGQVTPDWVPQLYLAPSRTLLASLSAWRSVPYLGQPNIHAGLAPVAALIALIRLMGSPAWVAIRVFRIIMLAVAGWGAMRLFHRLAGSRSRPIGRVITGVSYVANPFVIVSGSWMPTLLPYALFPWLLIALDRSVHQPRSWRWPAAFALVVFAMGGVNGGVVPILLVGIGVPAYLAYARLARITTIGAGAAACCRCVLLAMLVSSYWLIPTLYGQGSGSSIAFTTERPSDVAATSSYSEVLRLLGFWLMYGFRPNQASYASNPFVVAATFLFPATALFSLWVSRERLRILATTLLVVSIPVMVGIFPPNRPSPLGLAIRWVFEHVPGAIAFRTTTKAGALPAIALALLLGLGAQELVTSRLRHLATTSIAVFGILVLALGAFPALTGDLYASGWHVPTYWQAAARDLNAGSPRDRVLFLPGDYLAVYRWGMREVEDLNESLLSRPSIVRPVLIYGGIYGANLLAALDTGLEAGGSEKGMVSTVARYLGASEILQRNDMVWEQSGGIRPSRLALQVYEPDLQLERSYGSPGQNVVAIPTNDRTSPSWNDQQLPPLQRFSVRAPRSAVRTESVSGTILIDGDNFALGPMTGAGLLAGNPTFRLLGTMSPAEVMQAARDDGRIVLTDSNRRRIWGFRRTDQDSTATLAARDGVGHGRESYALFWDQPQKQTVVEVQGARAVRASGYGSVFGPVPSSRPALAFDGDDQTAWLVGDYGTAVGQWIRLDLPRPATLNHLVLLPARGGPVEIRSVRVSVGSRRLDVALPRGGPVPLSFPPTRASSVRVAITGTRGVGTNPVGFREVEVRGVRVREIVRLPETFSRLVERLRPQERAAVLSMPLDVLLTRQRGDPGLSLDDEERKMVRAFLLPAPRDFTFSGLSEGGPDLPDQAIDRIVGLPRNVVASSSGRAFGSVFTRAAQVLDGDPHTAWVPNGPGDWLRLSVPPQGVDHIVIRQGIPGHPTASSISLVTVSLNGGPPVRVPLSPGSTEIRFRHRRVHRITLQIDRITGLGGEVRVGEVQVGRVRVPRTTETTPLRGCVVVFTLDGAPVQASLDGTLGGLASGTPMRVSSCTGDGLHLQAGRHLLQATHGWLIDSMHLSSDPHAASPGGERSEPAGVAQAPPAAPARISVTASSPSRIEATATEGRFPYYVVVGQSFDDRWVATMDGRSLGRPILIDGYSVGWRIDDLRRHRFVFSFGPQRWATVGQITSGAGLLLLLLMFTWPRRGQRPLGLAAPLDQESGSAQNGPLDHDPGPPRASPARIVLLLFASGGVLWIVGGWGGLGAGASGGAILWGVHRLALHRRRWHLVRDPALAVPAALVAVIPLVVLFKGLPPAWELTPTFVRTNVLANYLAETALVLAGAALYLDARCRSARWGREDGPTDPSPSTPPSDHWETGFVYRSGSLGSESTSDPVTRGKGG